MSQFNLKELIPRAKFDYERANAAVEAGYPTVEPILPELLEWIQDMNWPIAQILAPFLATICEPLIPHIRNIFDSDDDIWKYWVLQEIVAESPKLALAFHSELERFATAPTENERAEGLDEISQEILEKFKAKN